MEYSVVMVEFILLCIVCLFLLFEYLSARVSHSLTIDLPCVLSVYPQQIPHVSSHFALKWSVAF